MGWLQNLKDMLARDSQAGLGRMDCPACHKGTRLRELRQGELGNVILDVCPRCHGVWFDKDELNQLDGSAWANVEVHRFHEVEFDHWAADCPKCDVALTPLSPADLPEIIIDRCPSCNGFWLDENELERMKKLAEEMQANQVLIADDAKPADWSNLRWIVHQLQSTRD